jgi:hypothetical protein
MPRVTIRTGFFTPDGRAEELSEFLCDAPGCPNVATQVVGVIREIGLAVVVCEQHAAARVTSKPAPEPRRESSP